VKKQIEAKPLPLKEPEQVGSGEKEIPENQEVSKLTLNPIKIQSDESARSDDLNETVKNKMDPKIYASFQKPLFVQTDKILFQKKRKLSSDNKTPKLAKLDAKPKDLKHSFQFY